jgi:hypothetical protein
VGEPIQGWLIGEIPQGLLVALDEDLSDVRVVSEYIRISYDHDRRLSKLRYDNVEKIRDELESANAAILDPMRRAISRLKFDELHQFGHRSAELFRHIHRARMDRYISSDDLTPRDELMEFLTAQADRSTSLHREVYETLEDSGLTEILDEYGPTLARLPPDLVIPAYDLEFESREELKSAFEGTREERWTSLRHRTSLEAAEETRIRLVVEASRAREKASEDKPEKPDDSTPFSRWVGPSLRVLTGTGLTAANAAIGVTAGLTATIATIGATAVPVYVGVFTSIYTGLAQVSDGLEKIGRRK